MRESTRLVSAQQIHEQASGNWVSILSSAGIPAEHLDGRGHPCPKCGGRDRFAAFADCNQRGGVHCRYCLNRASPIRPGDGIATIQWWFGISFREALAWLSDHLGIHSSNQFAAAFGQLATSSVPRVPATPETIVRMTTLAKQSYARMTPRDRNEVADELLVTENSLLQLRVGLTPDRRATTWPMRDAKANIIGVRIRSRDLSGEKWSANGSRNGIFAAAHFLFRSSKSFKTSSQHPTPRFPPGSTATPNPQRDFETLYVVEGASDTAAAVGLGLPVIGRSHCSGSCHLVIQCIAQFQPRLVRLIADGDAPGIEGAQRLAKRIQRNGYNAEVMVPPCGHDFRVWAARGDQGYGPDRWPPIEQFPALTRPRQLTFF